MLRSSIIDYSQLSPNIYGARTKSVDRITPHCYVGQVGVESMGAWFGKKTTGASCNYGIGADGRIAEIVPENQASICSSSRDNDDRAVTIECASDIIAPYAFRPAVYKSLVDLCVDICKRNGKTRLTWISDKDYALHFPLMPDEMLLTVHRWFKNKACPGEWMMARMGLLAEEVTTHLNEGDGNMTRYNTIEECPTYAQSTIKLLVDKGLLRGGTNGLELSEDMVRMLVILHRAGVFGANRSTRLI